MRQRVGNPFKDQHELFISWPMHIYDFVTLPTRAPHSVSQCIEYVVPELTVFARGATITEDVWDPINRRWHKQQVFMQDYDPEKQGWVNGAVWASWRMSYDEPCLYVAIGLYDRSCANLECLAGHKGIAINQAPSLAPWQLDAIKEEVGEHPRYRLGTSNDNSVLSSLGFTPIDSPLKSENVGWENLYTALGYLARHDQPSFEFHVTELQRKGYELDPDIVRAL